MNKGRGSAAPACAAPHPAPSWLHSPRGPDRPSFVPQRLPGWRDPHGEEAAASPRPSFRCQAPSAPGSKAARRSDGDRSAQTKVPLRGLRFPLFQPRLPPFRIWPDTSALRGTLVIHAVAYQLQLVTRLLMQQFRNALQQMRSHRITSADESPEEPLVELAGEMLNAVDEARQQPVGLAGGANARHARQELLQNDPDLTAGEMRAKTEVRARGTETDMRIR